jgi:biopolymer transport protein ExbB
MILLTILLQAAQSVQSVQPAAADSLAKAAQAEAATSVEKISLFHLLMEGGALMIPLLLCSLVLFYVFFERLFAIRKASVVDPSFMGRIRDQVEAGNFSAATSTCKSANTPLARVIEKGVSRIGKPLEYVEKSMENAGRLELYNMEKNLSVLNTIAGIAPILGFLGTIAGMIILFFNVQHQGFSLETIAGGIYTKMVTSATGLIIGLLAYVSYAYLNAQINKQINRIETASVEFLDYVQDIKH